MKGKNIVIPSEEPGGLSAAPCGHFGICPLFTVVSIENGTVAAVRIFPNNYRGCHNCLKPIRKMLDMGIDVLLTHRLGLYPLRVLEDLSISVLYFGKYKYINEIVDDFIGSKLRSFSVDDTCQGECERWL